MKNEKWIIIYLNKWNENWYEPRNDMNREMKQNDKWNQMRNEIKWEIDSNEK